MDINRNNYEIWFLDYFEGRLSSDQVDQLMAFLELHYDLKEEFDSFENVSLPAAARVVFDAKESLKKNLIISIGPINELNYEEYFIGAVEETLSKDDLVHLNAFIEKNPGLKKEYELFLKVKLTPDENIVFKGKESLKKNIIIPYGNINEENYAEHLIAATEGDATIPQLAEIKEFLSLNPPLKKDYDLFTAAKLTPDKSIVFDRKDELKQAVSTKKLFSLTKLYYPVSIAASIILLLVVYFLLPKETLKTTGLANRNNFDNKRVVIKTSEIPVIINTPDNLPNLAAVTPVKKNNTFVNESEYKDFQYASAISVKTIRLNSESSKEEIAEITVYEDFYAMVTKKRILAEEQKPAEDNKKVFSLKDFALFKLKKSIAPDDKKDKVTPDDTKITMWDVADAGVNKFNEITGANARINHKADDSGFSLALGDKFEISRSNSPKK